jgi:hypothetical protein
VLIAQNSASAAHRAAVASASDAANRVAHSFTHMSRTISRSAAPGSADVVGRSDGDAGPAVAA